jgi:hypothetical protein
VSPSEIAGRATSNDALVGMLVTLGNQTADTQPTFSSYGEFEAAGVLVDDLFVFADLDAGASLSALTGIVHISFGEVKLLPRDVFDLGYVHPSCDAAWTAMDDVKALNCNRFAEGELFTFNNLQVVSGANRFGAFFVVDPTATAGFGGLQVFSTATVTPPAVGTTVAVTGLYEEFNAQTELVLADATGVVEGAAGAATPLTVGDPCLLSEAHEGHLVTLPSVTVVAQNSTAASFGYFEVDGCSHIRVGGNFFADAAAFNAAAGGAGVITNLTGVVADRFDELTIHPRSAADWDSWAQ